MDLTIFTDGASRGNPGKAAYGFIIKDENGLILHEEGKTIGIATNNIAEYSAIKAAFTFLSGGRLNKKSTRLGFYMDSQLAARQLSGVYKIKNPALLEIYKQIKVLESQFASVSYTHVPRKENFIADKLANIALDFLKP